LEEIRVEVDREKSGKSQRKEKAIEGCKSKCPSKKKQKMLGEIVG
jgi:hypothetical protein